VIDARRLSDRDRHRTVLDPANSDGRRTAIPTQGGH
jgi:hypothetical protein